MNVVIYQAVNTGEITYIRMYQDASVPRHVPIYRVSIGLLTCPQKIVVQCFGTG